MWSKFSKIFHVVGATAAAVAGLAAAHVIAVPAGVTAAASAVAYVAGALGKALFGGQPADQNGHDAGQDPK